LTYFAINYKITFVLFELLRRKGMSQENDILFVIKKSNLDTGLHGYPVGRIYTSELDEERGIFYVGHSIDSLIDRMPEEVMYLLLYKKLPTENELNNFICDLLERANQKE